MIKTYKSRKQQIHTTLYPEAKDYIDDYCKTNSISITTLFEQALIAKFPELEGIIEDAKNKFNA
jgi:hypothetical protein